MHRTSVRSDEWVAAPSSLRRGSGIGSRRQTGAAGSDPEKRGEANQTRSRHQALSRVLISVTAMMVLVLVLASGVAARDPGPASVTVVVAAGRHPVGPGIRCHAARTGCAGHRFRDKETEPPHRLGAPSRTGPESPRGSIDRGVSAGSVSPLPYRANHVPKARRRPPALRRARVLRCRPAS